MDPAGVEPALLPLWAVLLNQLEERSKNYKLRTTVIGLEPISLILKTNILTN